MICGRWYDTPHGISGEYCPSSEVTFIWYGLIVIWVVSSDTLTKFALSLSVFHKADWWTTTENKIVDESRRQRRWRPSDRHTCTINDCKMVGRWSRVVFDFPGGHEVAPVTPPVDWTKSHPPSSRIDNASRRRLAMSNDPPCGYDYLSNRSF